MEFIFGLLVGVFGFYLVASWYTNAIIRAIQDSQSEPSPSVSVPIPAKIEEIDGIFYVYAVEKNEFLAQGSTSQELLAHLNYRMPNAHIRVIAGEPNVMQKFKAMVTN